MSILEVFQWVQYTEFATAFRGSSLAYPIVMTGHLTGMALIRRDDRDHGHALARLGDAELVDNRCGRSTASLETHWFCHGGWLRRHAIGRESGTVLSQSVLLDQDDVVDAGRRACAGFSSQRIWEYSRAGSSCRGSADSKGGCVHFTGSLDRLGVGWPIHRVL